MRKKSRVRLYLALIFLVFAALSSYFYLPTILGDTVYPIKYEEHIRKYSEMYGVDPALVAAVIFQESRFNPNAVSPKGAKGLMQFMPGTANTMAKEVGRAGYDIFDPETSIQFGAAHLRDLLVKYEGNLDAALAGYNAGTGNADKWIRLGILDRIPFRETNNYVKKIKNYRTVYATMYPKELGMPAPDLTIEEPNVTAQMRGFIWSQLFSNMFSYFD